MTARDDGSIVLGSEAQAIQDDPRWEVAERVARSEVFSRATQLQSILRYIVRQAILRPEEVIHEFEIAHWVLGRRNDFNPLDDNIVRVQIARLRKKLDLYFSGEGKNEQIVLSVALGSYKPVFSDRAVPAPELQPASETEIASPKGLVSANDGIVVTPAAPEIPEKVPQGKDRKLWTAAVLLLTLLLGVLGGFNLRFKEGGGQKTATISNPVIRQIFAPGAVINVIVSDASLAFLQDAVHSDISVAEYLNPGYPDNLLSTTADPAVRLALKGLAHHSLTSLNNADVAGQCFEWGTRLGAKTYVRYARYMHVRDFQQGNFVVVGSRRANPWTSLFERNLNFFLEEDPATHTFHFRNRNPRPGEPQIYEPRSEGGGVHISYVDIAILPNMARTGTVLLFDGLRMEDNEAAAGLILARDTPPLLTHALASLSPTSKTEILLRVRSLGGSEDGWEITSIRSSNP